MTTEDAISAIVTSQTLPSQIDYRVPYLIKADKACRFLNTLGSKREKEAINKANKQIEDYWNSEAHAMNELM